MPRLQDVERFKRDLASLSRESEVLARWGEEREEATAPADAVVEPERPASPPHTEAPRGLAARAARLRASPPPAEAPGEESVPPDFAQLLADLPLDEAEKEAEPLVADESEEPASTPEPLVEEGEAQDLSPLDDFDLAAFASLEEPQEPDTAAASLPQDSFPEAMQPEAVFEESLLEPTQEEAPPAATAAQTEAAEDFSLPDVEQFALDEAQSPREAAEIPEDKAAPEDAGFSLDEFSIPDFGEEAAAGDMTASSEALETFSDTENAPEPEPALSEAEAGFGEGEGLDLGGEGFALAGEAPAPLKSPSFSIPETGSGTAGIPEIDAFDSFDFGEGATSFGELDGENLDRELAALSEEAAPATTFKLDETWGADFEMPGEDKAAQARRAPPPPRAARAPGPSRPAPAEERVRPVELSEAQVDRLQDRLLALPLNLRIAVEESLAEERGTEAQRSRLVWMLVEGAALEDIALLAGRILERRISIPKGYEKSTGAALEAERGTFRYAFTHTILPLVRTILLALVGAAALGWLGWRFIYRPLSANVLYRSGYARIAEDRFTESEAAFAKASKIQDYPSWYYRYAEAYASRRQYILAERKYETLVTRYPREIKGALAWAALEKEQLKYREAVDILTRRILERVYYQKDALLLLGDVYLAWAEEEPKYYEEARLAYATLMERYGPKDEYAERMLLYFIRVDKLAEVRPLKERFMAADKPFPTAATLAELGAYLFDKGDREDVHRILMAAQKKDPSLPEAHYHLARYFAATGAPAEERKALDKAIAAYERMPALSSKRLAFRIDALLRRGENRLGDALALVKAGRLGETEFSAAEKDFSAAAALYEEALGLGRLARTPRFAEAYVGLAEAAYWRNGDFDAALPLFERAATHGFDSQRVRYERGYILYQKGRFAEALDQFYHAGLLGEASPYLDYAFGCALYARADYHAAEGYFRKVVGAMNVELERLDQPDPQGRASHGEIVELLMLAENNLGAALYRVANRLGDPARRASAMASFTESARLFDALERDQTTMVRPETKNLAFLNIYYVLHPTRGIDIEAYRKIPMTMVYPRTR